VSSSAFFPSSFPSDESPLLQWLCAQGRTEEAHEILARYHANGDKNDDLVLSEMAQINTALELEKEASAFGYLDFFKTAGNRKRLFLICYIGIFTQFLGNGIIVRSLFFLFILLSPSDLALRQSYYLLPILTSIGITGVTQQQGLNGGLQIFNLGVSVCGTIFINRFKRRSVWLFSTVGILVTYSGLTAACATYAKNASPDAGRAAVVRLFSLFASSATADIFFRLSGHDLPLLGLLRPRFVVSLFSSSFLVLNRRFIVSVEYFVLQLRSRNPSLWSAYQRHGNLPRSGLWYVLSLVVNYVLLSFPFLHPLPPLSFLPFPCLLRPRLCRRRLDLPSVPTSR
jgi:hypothetical protein